jgi:hypothetical protein
VTTIPNNGDRLRAEIAKAAARLMAEEGIQGFQTAKLKAAERLGVTGQAKLPSNKEIQSCLSEYLHVFHGEEHRKRLRRLRSVALDAMTFLEAFEPRLVGPVLHGTAGEQSPVSLHVFCDSSEELAWHLDAAAIPYRIEDRDLRLSKKLSASCPAYSFWADDVPIELIAFPVKYLHKAPLSSVDRKPMARADRARVESLLSDDCGAE